MSLFHYKLSVQVCLLCGDGDTSNYGLLRRDTTKLLLQINGECRYSHFNHIHCQLLTLADFSNFYSSLLDISIILLPISIAAQATVFIYISTFLLVTSFPRHCNKSVLDVGPSFLPTALAWLVWCGELGCVVLCSAVLQTINRRSFTITEKDPTRAFSWLKAPTSAFIFKTLLRHYP